MESPAQGGAPVGSSVQADPLEFNPPVIKAQRPAPQLVHVELVERRRLAGDSVAVASCHLAEVENNTAPICGLARKLLALGVDPGTHLSIWRGRTKCFHDLPVGRWGELSVEESAGGPVFRRYRPAVGAVEASQRRKFHA